MGAPLDRDLDNLRFEDLLERGDDAGVEALIRAARG